MDQKSKINKVLKTNWPDSIPCFKTHSKHDGKGCNKKKLNCMSWNLKRMQSMRNWYIFLHNVWLNTLLYVKQNAPQIVITLHIKKEFTKDLYLPIMAEFCSIGIGFRACKAIIYVSF